MAAKRNVELGFVEEKEIFLLKSRFFPSKVCGLPSWLSLNLLPSAKELTCRVCSKPTVFLLDDTQIVKESILEDINGILNTGEVANLFNNEEMGALVDNMMKPCSDFKINTGKTV